MFIAERNHCDSATPAAFHELVVEEKPKRYIDMNELAIRANESRQVFFNYETVRPKGENIMNTDSILGEKVEGQKAKVSNLKFGKISQTMIVLRASELAQLFGYSAHVDGQKVTFIKKNQMSGEKNMDDVALIEMFRVEIEKRNQNVTAFAIQNGVLLGGTFSFEDL